MNETAVVINSASSDALDVVSQRRGKNVAIIGLILQLVLAGVLFGLWRATGSLAAMSLSWVMASGTLLWLMAIVLFYTRQLQCQEALELEQIAAQADAGSIFEQDDISLRPALRRVGFILRWIVPIFTMSFAAYVMGVGALIFKSVLGAGTATIEQTFERALTVSIFFTVGVGFAGFLFSRYATGMGSQAAYRPLRAAGSYLLVCVLGSVAMVVALVLAYRDVNSVDRYVALVLPAVMFVFAVEMLLNFVLDIYRPRVAGQEVRLSYDSRLFNLIAEPGRVGHSLAEALNYQFGFEVSKTWFYQLLSRAMIPLLLAGVAIMIGLTAVVVVPEGEEVVVTQLGTPMHPSLKPGLRFKLPWPLATATRYNTGSIQEVLLGAGEARTSEEIQKNFVQGKEVQLWTEEHGAVKEKDFLVAVPVSRDNPAAVNLIKLVTSVQYKIDDPYKFAYAYDDAKEMLQCVAYQEMVSYLASATLLENDLQNPDRPQAIMTTGRIEAAQKLMERIQKRVGDKDGGLDMGVTIVNVSFQAVHPPVKAAEAFQKVLEAERRREEKRYEAQAQANRILAQVAGSPSSALRLAFAIEKYQDLTSISRSQGKDLSAIINDALGEAQKSLSTLDEDIQRDVWSGKSLQSASPSPLLASTAPSETAETPDTNGSVGERMQLREDYRQYVAMLESLKADPSKVDLTKALAAASEDANALFVKARGEPAKRIAEATAGRWTKEMAERARAEVFQRQEAAFNAAPRIYMFDRWMDVMSQVLPNIPKKIIAVDRNKYEIWSDSSRSSQPLQGALEDTNK